MENVNIPRKCVFDNEKECPVKKEYKLKPESLVEFCKTCKINEGTKNMDIEKTVVLIAEIGAKFIEAINTREGRLLDLIEKFVYKSVGA